MRISTQVNYAGDIKAACQQVARLEDAGLDMVFVAEAYGFDSVSFMGYLAAITDRVQIAAGIIPLYSRTPTLVAMTAAGLDALSDGRFVLGLGASGPQVIEGFHGVPYDRPLQRTRETIEICRKVWKRERLVHEGKAYTLPLPPEQGTGLGKPLKMITHPVREDIPIVIAALGEKNVAMTAEVADGWLPIFYWPERADRVWGECLAAGTAKHDPSLGPLDVVAGGAVAIGDGIEHLREMARPQLALYIGGMGAKGRNFYNTLCQRYGYEKEAEQIQDLYLDGKKDEAAALVPTELLEGTSLIGSEGYVRDRLAAYRDAGVTTLNIAPLGPDPIAIVEQVKTWTS